MSNKNLNKAENKKPDNITEDSSSEPKLQTAFDLHTLTGDLNNILTIIICLTEVIRAHPCLPSELEPDLSRVIAQAWRAAHLIRKFLGWQSD